MNRDEAQHAAALRELDELVDQVCEKRIDAAGRARLNALLRESDACRERYLQYVDLHSSLWWSSSDRSAAADRTLREEASVVSPDSEAPAATISPRSMSLLQRASRHPRGPAIAIAVAVMLMVVGVMAVTPVSNWIAGSGKDKTEERETEAQEDFVARLTDWHNDRWLEGSRPPLDDPRLNIGRRLVLESGLAEITYDTGAVLVVEGPAEMVVLGKKRIALDFGKLVGLCESEQAKGFVVETPSADVEDLGTEFAVDVDRRGRAYVEVFDGKVSVGDRESPPRFALVELGADSAVVVNVSGGGATASIRHTTAGARHFARAMPREVPRVELLAHYTFDENSTANVAGEANQLTANGNPKFVATEIDGLGDAIDLDGVDDYAICESAVHPLGNDSYTWAMWVRFDDLPVRPTRNHNLIQWGVVQPDGGTFVGLRCGQMPPRLRVNHVSLKTDRTSNYTPSAGKYLHVVGTRHRLRERIYVNGQLQDEIRYDGGTRTVQGPLVVGAISSATAQLTEYSKARIADLQIYRGWVEDDQVEQLHKNPGSALQNQRNALGDRIESTKSS